MVPEVKQGKMMTTDEQNSSFSEWYMHTGVRTNSYNTSFYNKYVYI
jgi:hypothetical protein